MDRRMFLKSTGIGALAAGMPALSSFGQDRKDDGDKPNVVLIMVDDMGAEAIECYGGTTYKTPCVDALAADGLRFENAFSQPICGPTRACILSGRYPFRSGVATNHGIAGFKKPWGRKEKPEITFANLMKQQGYATAIAGKWALCQLNLSPDHLTQCGFDKFRMWPKMYKGKVWLRYWNPAFVQDGVFEPELKGVFGPDHECDYLIDFMRTNKDRPFLVYWPMTLIHGPLQAPPGVENNKVRHGKGS